MRRPAHLAFDRNTTIAGLVRVFEAQVLPTNARGKDGLHPSKLADDIRGIARRLSQSMRSGTHRFTSYRERLLSKGAGKNPRVLSIATSRDRIVLKALAQFLQEVFPERTARTAQAIVDEVARALRSGQHDTFVRIDLREFYPSINHTALFAELGTRIRKRQPLDLLRRAITTPTIADGRTMRQDKPLVGVPQGLAISNILAEVMMGVIDRQFTGSENLAYFRFVDDVLILCSESGARVLFERFDASARAVGLTVHPLGGSGSKSAIGPIAKGFSFLGYQFVDSSVSVREESVRRVEGAIARVFTRFRHQRSRSNDKSYQRRIRRELAWRLNLIITGCTFHRVRRGWVAYYSQITDLSVLKRLDAVVARNTRRFKVRFKEPPKSFMRAHWRTNYPSADSGAYIPNFDTFTNVEKRQLLVKVLGEGAAGSMTNAQIDSHFGSRVFKIVRELETHIGDVS